MRKIIIIGIVAVLAALSPLVASGAQGSDSITADLQVADSISVYASWVGTGLDTQDFGVVPLNSTTSDNINLSIIHNMGTTQTFSLTANVNKLAGPAWDSTISMSDGSEFLIWAQADFGTNAIFTDSIGGTAETFDKTLATFINVGTNQEPSDSYQFQYTFTVTSL